MTTTQTKKTRFNFSTNTLNAESRTAKPIKTKKLSDKQCANLYVYRYANGRMAFYFRINETITAAANGVKGKYKKVEVYLADFEPYGPSEQIETMRLEVAARRAAKKDNKPIVQDPLFSTITLKFIKEGLEGFRISYLSTRKNKMVKYDANSKKQIKNNLLNVVLHRTKKAELLARLTRSIVADTVFIKDKRISKITKDDIDQIMQRLAATPRMANLIKAHISMVFEWAMISGFCSINPTKDIGLFILRKPEKISLDKITARRFINNLKRTMSRDPHLKAIVALAHLTGIRLKHLMGLTWKKPVTEKEFAACRGYINMEQRFIHVHRDKKDEEHTQYFDQDTGDILNKLFDIVKGDPDFGHYAISKWVFPKPTMVHVQSDYDTWKKGSKKLYKKFGIPEGYTNRYARKTAGTYIGKQHGEEAGAAYLDNGIEVFKKHYYDSDKDKFKDHRMYDVKDEDLVKSELVALKGGKK